MEEIKMNNELFEKLTNGSFYDRFLNFMKAAGLKQVRVSYSGGGDSGGPDGIEISPNTNRALNSEIVSQFEEELSEPIYQRHGSFADGGGYSVDGRVIWDAANNNVIIEGTDHYYTYEDSDSEDEDAEETQTDTEWGEVIFSKSEDYEDVASGDSDYSLLCLYAKWFLKGGKLPEEYHNRVLMAAVDGEDSAKEYIDSLKK